MDEVKPKTQVEILCDRLYGPNGLGVQNFHVSVGPGNPTAEQVATEVNRAMDAIARGDFEVIDNID